MGWIGGVRFFRNGLVNIGCSLSNMRGFSSVVSADGKAEFFIMSGVRGAGRHIPGKQPRSKAPRGLQTIKRIEENQLSFPAELLFIEVDSDEGDISAREHWCFLYHITKKLIYSEFSKPTAVDDKGYVVEWSERIILDPIPIASETVNVGENEAAPVAEVPVTLKKSNKDDRLRTRKTKTSS